MPSDECLAEPDTVADITTILRLDGQGVRAPSPIRITLPLGTMADAETTREIRAAVRQILACFNVGDIPRATGLMTKRGVEGVFSGLIVTEEGRELARTRITTTELRAEGNLVSPFAVTDLSVLRDERVCALVLLDEALLPPDGAETLLFVFAKQNDRWRLDDRADFTIVPGGAGTNATPTP